MKFTHVSAVVLSAFLIGAMPVTAMAQAAPTPSPQQLLSQYPAGGNQLATVICDITVANPGVVNAVLDLASTANPGQKKAIANGLACASRNLAATRPAASDQISQAVAAFDDDAFQVAYADALNDEATAGLGTGRIGGGPVARSFAFTPGAGSGGNNGVGNGVGGTPPGNPSPN